ncbi:DUF6497 family protein [Loktanella sp. TSTF-M6]|uniref:DUF6497 family protein n=1 Tax=Loktanella gaetbuli TaxID=2881335 RepID=A0ABS8BV05_9RHOB|nr:DUF6497 family protein [Loktanella gaetbuli]MCB5199549.1 DUF6497 family protein [Loktanella gaetbuli]
MPATAQQTPQPIAVPSGLQIALADVIMDTQARIARFRFLSPALAGGDDAVTFTEVVDDLTWLCDVVVVPALQQQDWDGDQIVLSVSDKPTTFGIYDPQVVQFFQPFRVTDGRCSWDEF